MTKAEKRHFKLSMAKYHTEASKYYIQLFDAIEAQKVFNSQELSKKFKNIPGFKHMPMVKAYLHRQILKSLKNFHDEASSNIILNNYLTEIEVLYTKELFTDCTNTIKKAKAYAEKHEKFPKLMEIIFWEARVADAHSDMKKINALKNTWEKEVQDALEKYDEINTLRRLSFEIQSFTMKTGEAKGMKDKEFLKKLLSRQVLNRKMQSFSGELSRLAIKARCLTYSHDCDNETKLASLTDVVNHFESQPHQIDNQINVYFNYVLLSAHIAKAAQKYTLTESLVKKMQTFYSKGPDKLMIQNYVGFLSIQANLLLQKGEFKQALEQVPAINRVIEDRGRELGTSGELSLYDLYFNIYFWNRDFKKAQIFIQKILNYPVRRRQDIQLSARLTNLILQYELGEFQHLGYVLRSTYRFMLKQQQINTPERIILNFLKNAPGFHSEKQLLDELKKLKAQILPHLNDYSSTDFPLIEWINSKLQNKSLAEIIKENYLAAVAKEEEEEQVGVAI